MDTASWLHVVSALIGLSGMVCLALALRRGGKSRPCQKCQRLMMPEWNRCLFCGTPCGPDHDAGKLGVLHFVSGPLVDQVALLDRPKVIVGSVGGNDIILKDTGVSRKHAGILRIDGGYKLSDLGSKNGTFVNGEKIPHKKLAVGDIIRVGNSEIVFRVL